MNQFIIVTDTSSDLPKQYLDLHQIPVLTLYYTIDGVTSTNGCPTPEAIQSFYDKMRSGLEPKTQQVDPDQASALFRALLEQGKDILYLGFSSGLSGTVNSARIAAEELRNQFPNQTLLVLDTLCASLGQGLIVDYAVTMRDAGHTLDEIAGWVEAHKCNVCHTVTVEDLAYLQRGGRISKTTAMIGTMIGIKPIIHVDNNGKLVPVGKVRGRKPSLISLADRFEEQSGSFGTKQKFAISHGDCLEDATFVAELIQQRTGSTVSLINDIGPTIGSHAGPGTVALFFMGDER